MENYDIDEVKIEAGQVLCVVQKRNKKLYVCPLVLNKKRTRALNLITDSFYKINKEETEYGENISLSDDAITELEGFAPIIEVGRLCSLCDKCAWKLFKSGDAYKKEKTFRQLIAGSYSDKEFSTTEICKLTEKIESVLNNENTTVEKEKIKTLGPSGDVREM